MITIDYLLFSVELDKKNKIKEILTDDILSRQSITTRDASALNIKKNVQYILIEGSENALTHAKDLFKDIGTLEKSPERENIYKLLKAEEANVAVGVGFIFGD